MEIRTLVSVLEAEHVAAEQLSGWRLRDMAHAQQVLRDLAAGGLSLELLAEVCRQLGPALAGSADADAALSALGRYFSAVRSSHALAALIERDPTVLPTLVAGLSLGPYWANLLVADPDALDLLRQADRQGVTRVDFLAEIQAEVAALGDERSTVNSLSRFHQRHLLRIAYHESAGNYTLAEATRQLTELAEAIVAAALSAAGPPERTAILAAGDVGGRQSSYSFDLPLLVVYEPRAGAAPAESHPAMERAAKHLGRLLAETLGEWGRVELLPLPEGTPGAAAHTADDVVHGFDSFGRTWHRQQLLKARTIAGDADLGERLRERLSPWLFRRYLNRADEAGIQAWKRRIIVSAAQRQDDWRNVWLARGGLNDLDASRALLQLVVGHERPAVRGGGPDAVWEGLVSAKVLTAAEHQTLKQNAAYLKTLAHRHEIRLGPAAAELPADLLGDEAVLRTRLDENWAILRRLLEGVFPEAGPTAREVELLLDPQPPPHEIRAALSPFGFRDPEAALQELNDLATEQIPFLSTRRCRHLLARILPRLLCAIAATPDPDRTLVQLARVSNSLGGKAVLWDLFQASPASLELYTKLCAASPYLSDILTTNPGMIDELVDSLQLDRLPTAAALGRALAELSRGSADTLPILHDLKNAAHLRIGVRDILGKEDIDATHAALADVAEMCLTHVLDVEYRKLVEKHGVPTHALGPRAGEPSRMALVALGKLGGREPNYHSRLDILLLYEADGATRPARPSRRGEATANNHFFTRLAQHTIKQLSELTPKGRLYPVEVPLRPIGIGGALAITFAEFANHFAGGGAPLWQWLALTQARPVYGAGDVQQHIAQTLGQLLQTRPWTGTEPAETRQSRQLLARDAGPANLKRAPGGTLDVEFLVQLLQLKHAVRQPDLLIANTQSAIAALARCQAIPAERANRLADNYRFLRRIESGLRLLNTLARHDFPDDAVQLAQLAFLLGHSNPERLREQCQQAMADNRDIFDSLTAE